ncbi:23S rRNA (adenine-N6)-dimethyltransferase [Amycolatopsis arida]|uniref:23S rRNA (Adenine-N6)-dimethyltransferase n=1 Tax=Amycolatopsis arida TaxID=587909 RepID=A0A1I5KS30_9PSEU|nr:23S rRNA (adenine-N6)-dimethyltransferase [Amycolatopsis arida]SFO87742.1 23S rRNA (adenine-N6)-dimethyltransferase [Amycolatopsis arida]
MHGHTQRDRNRRQFGQNFLRDRAAVLRIVDAAELRPDLPVVEAGPGEGLLTRELARRAREVLAYEIDPDMAEPLWQRFAGESNVRIVNRDFLTAKPPAESFAFVGAIPYGVTSAIVDWCLAARALVSATMVTQLEFARKRTGNYGRWSLLTVSTWPRFAWEFHGRIDRRLFRPVPRVDSAILRLARRDRPLLSGAALTRYETMVELCFSGVGGSVRASLRRMFDRGRIDAALGAAGIGRDTVVAFVHPNQWIRLFAELNQR